MNANLQPARDLSEVEARERLASKFEQEAACLTQLASYGGCYVTYYDRARELREHASRLRKGSPQ